MKKDEILSIVKTINEQLLWSASLSTQLCWGVERRIACLYENKATLKLKVNGFEHKGYVLISYDEGSDTYELRLTNENEEVVKFVENVYCDEIGSLVDRYVEYGDCTEEEYKEKVKSFLNTQRQLDIL